MLVLILQLVTKWLPIIDALGDSRLLLALNNNWLLYGFEQLLYGINCFPGYIRTN